MPDLIDDGLFSALDRHFARFIGRFGGADPHPILLAAALVSRFVRPWGENQARRLKIEPALICSKTAMPAIAERRPSKPEDLAEIPELRTWQRKNFGREIIAALQKER